MFYISDLKTIEEKEYGLTVYFVEGDLRSLRVSNDLAGHGSGIVTECKKRFIDLLNEQKV